MAGPTIQDDVLSILLRFLQHRYVVSGDVENYFSSKTMTATATVPHLIHT